jgi:hypothetical protein
MNDWRGVHSRVRGQGPGWAAGFAGQSSGYYRLGRCLILSDGTDIISENISTV